MINLKQLVEGWKNTLAPDDAKKELIDFVSNQRRMVCDTCSYHSKNHKTIRPDDHCTHCGCTLIAKTKCLSCECPIKKWTEVNLNP